MRLLRPSAHVLALTALLLALSGRAAQAQWRVANERPAGVETPIRVALVENKRGDILRVYRDDDSVVRGIFTLAEGFDTLLEGACPTYRVDREPAAVVSRGDDACGMDARSARFVLGEVEGNRVHSDALLELIDGTAIVFRYHLNGVGYRESRFSLRRSKQALNTSIGKRVQVVKE